MTDAMFDRTRRRMVGGAGAGAIAATCGGVRALAAPTDPLSGTALFADVVTYCGFGDHRTATDADLRTSAWLAAQLGRAGLQVRLSPWTTQQFFLRRHALHLDGGEEIASFPLWWPRPTGPQPVSGPLTPLEGGGDLAGKVALAAVEPVPGASLRAGDKVGQLVTAAARRKARGLILVTQDPAGEIVALNAMSGLGQWPIPVLCVGGRDEQRLRAAASAGQSASLLIDGSINYAAKAFEVVGSLERGPRRVVVSTPSSGWFQCAGERGPGIALWLGLARWAARQGKGAPSYTFVASSGHEMEAIGMRHFAGDGAPPVADTRTWLHLGAGIATYAYRFGPDGPRRLDEASLARRLMTNDRDAVPILERRFAGLPGLKPIYGDDPGGEMVLMSRQGYRVWGFAGASAFHHMPGDTPERATGPELLEPVARAIAATLRDVTNT